MEPKFTKEELELFETIQKIYKRNPELAISFLNDDEQIERFSAYQRSLVSDVELAKRCLKELEGDDDEQR